MTFYQGLKKSVKKFAETECPICHSTYTMGVTGTKDGCDECLGIVRNPIDNTIIEDYIPQDAQA